MIQLTRLNGSHLAINCDLIKYAESAPDTVLTSITGEKLVVLEPCDEVSQRTLRLSRPVLRIAWPDAAGSVTAKVRARRTRAQLRDLASRCAPTQ